MASQQVDVAASEIQLRKNFTALTKYVIHEVLDLPIDGDTIVSDTDAGRDFLLSHFNVTTIPIFQTNSNLLKRNCLMRIFSYASCVLLSPHSCVKILGFRLAPNSSTFSGSAVLLLVKICPDLCMSVSLAALESLKNLPKLYPRGQSDLAGATTPLLFLISTVCILAFSPSPMSSQGFFVWRGNKIKQFLELDKNNSRSYGKRPLKRLSPSIFLPKSCEKNSSSAVNDVAAPRIPFATKVEATFASCFGNETIKQLIGVIQSSLILVNPLWKPLLEEVLLVQ